MPRESKRRRTDDNATIMSPVSDSQLADDTDGVETKAESMVSTGGADAVSVEAPTVPADTDMTTGVGSAVVSEASVSAGGAGVSVPVVEESPAGDAAAAEAAAAAAAAAKQAEIDMLASMAAAAAQHEHGTQVSAQKQEEPDVKPLKEVLSGISARDACALLMQLSGSNVLIVPPAEVSFGRIQAGSSGVRGFVIQTGGNEKNMANLPLPKIGLVGVVGGVGRMHKTKDAKGNACVVPWDPEKGCMPTMVVKIDRPELQEELAQLDVQLFNWVSDNYRAFLKGPEGEKFVNEIAGDPFALKYKWRSFLFVKDGEMFVGVKVPFNYQRKQDKSKGNGRLAIVRSAPGDNRPQAPDVWGATMTLVGQDDKIMEDVQPWHLTRDSRPAWSSSLRLTLQGNSLMAHLVADSILASVLPPAAQLTLEERASTLSSVLGIKVAGSRKAEPFEMEVDDVDLM